MEQLQNKKVKKHRRKHNHKISLNIVYEWN